MLDISRDKVPTLDTLYALIDQLAEWKINHIELYTEHTFAYQRHPTVWAKASPLTGEDILRLDAYCRAQCVELVPNQNSFGHMERWLTLPAYRDLAECPDGYETSAGTRAEHPTCLNPLDPRSIKLIAELHDELLAHFTSRKFNVGCDETWELGQGKCKELSKKLGPGRVYLDFLLKLHKLVKRHGRTMHFWGDIIIKHPELVVELPRDSVVLEWGYESDHPFAEHGARFAASGLPFYVCPGTSSWNTIAGRTENCLANLRNAAENGLRHGAVGFLNTDWGDNGHWQYLPVSYLGFAAGAALAWCVRANREADIRPALDRHVFLDAAGVMGGLAHDLGNAYLKSGHRQSNSTVLFHLLQKDMKWPIPATVTLRTLGETREYIEGVVKRLARARMARPDAVLIQDEFANAARMLVHACDRGQWRLKPAAKAGTVKVKLARDLRMIIGEHRRLWLARNRPGGLKDSIRRLETRLSDYR
jgi:DNA polymerase III psi subunit